MPQKTIPLIGPFTQRMGAFQQLLNGKDQFYTDVVFSSASEQITNSISAYAEKRPGLQSLITIGTGVGNALLLAHSSQKVISCLGTKLYYGTTTAGTHTDCGTVSAAFIYECSLNSVITYLITDTSGNGWFLATDAAEDSSPTFTGDTHTNTTIDNISSLTNVYVGMLLSGTGIQAGTRIASIDSASSITTTLATTATNSTVTITFERVAKIINANFPSGSLVGYMSEINGRAYAMSTSGKIYNSSLNDPATWSANGFVTANLAVSVGSGLTKVKNYLVAFGRNSTEFFQDVGNSSGSPLQRMTDNFSNVGPANGYSYVKFADKIYFLSQTGGGNFEIYRLDGSQPNISSPQMINRIIGSTHTNSIVPVTPIAAGLMNGNTYLFFNVTAFTTKLFLCYCVELDKWSRLGWTEWYYIGGASALYGIDSSTASGKLFYMNTSFNDATRGLLVFQDNGSSYTMTIQTEPYALNSGLPFIIDNITLLADTQASGSSTLSSTADDYATFGTIGSFDLTQQQKNIAGGGYYDSTCAFKLTDSGNQPWRGQALIVTYRPA